MVPVINYRIHIFIYLQHMQDLGYLQFVWVLLTYMKIGDFNNRKGKKNEQGSLQRIT